MCSSVRTVTGAKLGAQQGRRSREIGGSLGVAKTSPRLFKGFSNGVDSAFVSSSLHDRSSQTLPGNVSRQKESQRAAAEQLELFPPSRYLTIEEVAELMHVPKSFIYRRTCRGHDDPIPSFRFGGHLRFRLDEIEEWIANHRVLRERVPGIREVRVRRAVAAQRNTRRSGRQLRRETNSVKSRSR